ncbi:unnamed protein product, partial [marine sediment metagenome]
EKWNQWYEMRTVSSGLIYSTSIVSGCFSLFRTEVFQKVGLYDERFFMYFEDFDISRRVNKYFKTVYYPKVSVYHEYRREAQKNPRLFKIFVKSAIKYFNKWGWFFDHERNEINKSTIEQVIKQIK